MNLQTECRMSIAVVAILGLTILAGPIAAQQTSIAVSASTSVPSGSITATLSNEPGGAGDWIALAQVGANDQSYLQWQWVVNLKGTPKTWSVIMPAAAGTYEFRLFLNGGYQRQATSPPVTVATPQQPPTIAVSASAAPPGGRIVASIANAPGGVQDWIALAPVGAADQSYLQWQWVNVLPAQPNQTRAWSVTMPTQPGTYEFRFFVAGGYSRAATSPPVTVGLEELKRVGATCGDSGRAIVIVRAGSSTYWAKSVDGSGGSWTRLSELPGGRGPESLLDPTTAAASGTPYLFVVAGTEGQNNTLWSSSPGGSTWNWTDLGRPQFSDPRPSPTVFGYCCRAVTACGTPPAVIAADGRGNELWSASLNGSSWSWRPHGSLSPDGLGERLALREGDVSLVGTSPHIFALSGGPGCVNGNDLWSSPLNGSELAWSKRGRPTTEPRDFSVVNTVPVDGTTNVVVRASRNCDPNTTALWSFRTNGSSESWVGLGSPPGGGTQWAYVRGAVAQPVTFAVNYSTGVLWSVPLTGSSPPPAWTSHGQPSPTVKITDWVGAVSVSGRSYVFVLGSDGNLWSLSSNATGGGWSWANQGRP